MSYSIREGIDELKEKLRAEEEIAKKYPDATLRTIGGRQLWVSGDVVPTDFDMFADAHHSSSVGLLGYVNVGGMRVYQEVSEMISFIPSIAKTEFPLAYEALVAICKRGGRK